MSAHDSFSDDAGAYVLGALEPDEHEAYEAHLRGCDACREEVARLAVARDALPRSVEPVPPPLNLKASLMETVRADADARAAARAPAARRTPGRRGRWRELLSVRPAFAAAAAAAVLALGVGAGAIAGAIGGGGDGGDSRTIRAFVDQTRMPVGEASLVLQSRGRDGAQLRVEGMQQPQSGKVYEVWIKRGNRVRPSSLFTVERNGSGTAAIPGDLRKADAVMVTREPEGGSREPSEPPLVVVPVRS